jgi:hypothetical protein
MLVVIWEKVGMVAKMCLSFVDAALCVYEYLSESWIQYIPREFVPGSSFCYEFPCQKLRKTRHYICSKIYLVYGYPVCFFVVCEKLSSTNHPQCYH